MVRTALIAMGVFVCASSAAFAAKSECVQTSKAPLVTSLPFSRAPWTVAECHEVCVTVVTGIDAAGREIYKTICHTECN